MVLPVPGGPQKTSEPSVRVSSMRVSAPSGPSRWSWPTTSSSLAGRSLSASGRGASRSSPAAANRLGPPRRAGAFIRAAPPTSRRPPRTMVMRHARLCCPATRSRSRVLAILVLLTDSTRSPRLKPRLCADEPLATSTITTPWIEGSSRRSSASAGDRLPTLAPWNGERASITISSRAVSGAASSATATAVSLPPRSRPSLAVPPSALVAKR